MPTLHRGFHRASTWNCHSPPCDAAAVLQTAPALSVHHVVGKVCETDVSRVNGLDPRNKDATKNGRNGWTPETSWKWQNYSTVTFITEHFASKSQEFTSTIQGQHHGFCKACLEYIDKIGNQGRMLSI